MRSLYLVVGLVIFVSNVAMAQSASVGADFPGSDDSTSITATIFIDATGSNTASITAGQESPVTNNSDLAIREKSAIKKNVKN